MNQRDVFRLETGSWQLLGTAASAVREAVFVIEQQIPASLEWEAADADYLHCVIFENDMPVATGRLLPDGHIGRMAVLASHRGLGLGGRVLQALIDSAQARGQSKTLLNAQLSARPFYEKFGYQQEGELFMEAGIEHVAMVRG